MQEHISGLRQTNAELSIDLSKLSRVHAELSTEASALSKELYDLDAFRAREKDKYTALVHEHNSALCSPMSKRQRLPPCRPAEPRSKRGWPIPNARLQSTQTMLFNKEAEATLLASHLDRARDEVRASDAARVSAVEKYERQGFRVADLEGQLKDTQEAHSESLTRLRVLALKLEAHEGGLRQAAQVEEELRLKHDSLVERMRTVERGLIDRIDRLRTENAALQGALGAARQECASLSRDLTTLRQTLPGQAEEPAGAETEVRLLRPLWPTVPKP